MNAISAKPIIKSRKRVADHGEVFTPPFIVQDMLALVADKVRNIQSRFLEPACGDGNFLVAILDARLTQIDRKFRSNQPQWEINAFFAVSSLYGIELLADNVFHCRRHLLRIFRIHYEDRRRNFWTADKDHHNNQFFAAVRFVISCNIVQGNALTMCRTVGAGDELPQAIIFSEWNTFQNNQIIRKEWVYQNLVENTSTSSRHSERSEETHYYQEKDSTQRLQMTQNDLFADLFEEDSFRQPENHNRHIERSEVSQSHHYKEKDSSPAVQNDEKNTPFTQTREFPPVNYWEISEETYQKLSKQRRRKKGGRNA